MSSCWTLTHKGLTEGIEIVATAGGSFQVVLGEEWHLSTNRARPRLVRTAVVVPFVRQQSPRHQDGRVQTASTCKSGGQTLLRSSRPNDHFALVLIDTGHTALCKSGGFWTLEDDAEEIVKGRVGHGLYRTGHRTGRLSDYNYEIQEDTCYNRGLVLLPPNSHVMVTFHAPGRVTGVLRHLGNKPEFWLDSEKADPNYVYRHHQGLRLNTIPPELL